MSVIPASFYIENVLRPLIKMLALPDLNRRLITARSLD